MSRIICWFSNGAASAVAAKLTIDKYGRGKVLAVCCDTRSSEHPDNYRFSQDCERWFGQEIIFLKSSEYKDITELPIRKWNNLTADFGYAGCDPKEILRYIQKGLEAETPQQRQVKFVSELCDAIKAEVGARIVKGDLPPEWDGHELRVLLARKFQESAEMSVILKYPRNKRAKDFKNHMLVNNI